MVAVNDTSACGERNGNSIGIFPSTSREPSVLLCQPLSKQLHCEQFYTRAVVANGAVESRFSTSGGFVAFDSRQPQGLISVARSP
jgi:hypothetical protein